MVWQVKQVAKATIKDPVLIEGLPGMGNVGKIAVDFVIDALKAKKIYELFSYDLPHCVFINKENIMELPTINVYHKQCGKRSLLFLAGDIQPISESSCYEFCNTILDTFHPHHLAEIITLGGVALPKVPKDPKVYCTGNSKSYIRRFPLELVNRNIYGVVGPIIGVSGLLPGLAGKRNIPAAALLAETYGHPNYLGVRGARSLLQVLSKQLNLRIDLRELDAEVENVEEELVTKSQQLNQLTKMLKKKASTALPKKTDYIG